MIIKELRKIVKWRNGLPIILAAVAVAAAVPAAAQQQHVFRLRAESSYARQGTGLTTHPTGTQNPFGQGAIGAGQSQRQSQTRPQQQTQDRTGIDANPCFRRVYTPEANAACAARADAQRRAEIERVRSGANARPIKEPVIRVPNATYHGPTDGAALNEVIRNGLRMPRNGTVSPVQIPSHNGGFRNAR
jgi:hypothetical protein